MTELGPIFDAHFHIIDPRFDVVPNAGYVPDPFTVPAYRRRVADLDVRGGAVVSGSFQGFDQRYLTAALAELGPGFVGVTQIPAELPDGELDRLARCGVRAVRFNLRRGGSAGLEDLEPLAHRVFDRHGWHVELYVDATELDTLFDRLVALPRVCIDHLGLREAGLPTLLRLVERGVWVKATGFGRFDGDPGRALAAIAGIDPCRLVFGTDLPSTRAPRPFELADARLVVDILGEADARRVLHDNAIALYRPTAGAGGSAPIDG